MSSSETLHKNNHFRCFERPTVGSTAQHCQKETTGKTHARPFSCSNASSKLVKSKKDTSQTSKKDKHRVLQHMWHFELTSQATEPHGVHVKA